MDFLDLGVGQAAIAALEKLDFEVVLVAGHCCGRAALSQGMLGTAREQARGLEEALEPLLSAGLTVLGVEPSCMAAVVDDHPRLLGHDLQGRDCRGGRGATSARRELLGFLDEIAAERGAGIFRPEDELEPLVAVLHGHCQQKTMGWLQPAISLLSKVPGIEVRTTTSECCGMAGSFGFKSELADVSIELGRRLLDEIDSLGESSEAEGTAGVAFEGDADASRSRGSARVEILASGTSCRSQIHDLSRNHARHPVELVVERLR
jgi:Fe-S oxidoreductase